MSRSAMKLLLINDSRWLEVGSRLGWTKDEGHCSFLLLRVILGISYFLRNYLLFALWFVPSLKLQLCYPHPTVFPFFVKTRSIF